MYVHVHMHSRMYVCMPANVRMNVCMYVCMYVFPYVYIHTDRQTDIYPGEKYKTLVEEIVTPIDTVTYISMYSDDVYKYV